MIISDFYQTKIESFSYEEYTTDGSFVPCYTLDASSITKNEKELIIKVSLFDFNNQPVKNKEVELNVNAGFFSARDVVTNISYSLSNDNKTITATTGDDGAVYVHYGINVGERGITVFSANATLIQINNLNPYPVGSVYVSFTDTNPSSLFGGEWIKIEGRFLLATDATKTVNSTGGSATVSLSVSQMPRHTHSQYSHSHGAGDNLFVVVDKGVNLGLSSKRKMTSTSGSYTYMYGDKDVGVGEWAKTSGTTASNYYTGGTGSAQSQSNGSAHENMPPYIAVHMWRRVK